MGLEFNQTASPEEIPQADAVATTLEEAISNPNNNFNISVDVSSIQVIPPIAIPTSTTTSAATTTTRAATTNTTTTPTTTSAATTTTRAATTNTTTTPTTTITTATTIAEAVTIRQLTFRSVGETFTTDLQNRLSAAFIARASLIETTLNPIYQQQFSSFRSLTVILFSNGSIVNNMNIGFASTSVPNATQIGNILADAASNITAFNIEPASILLDGAPAPTTAATTTAAPTTAATTTTTTPTTTITTATTIAEAVTIRQLTFRSVGETFTTDLQNRLSAAFIARASLIETMLNPIYQQQFSSFRSLTVILFSNGSIFNIMNIGFVSTSVPNATQIGNILADAASSITAFNIEPASILLDGAQVSNGVCHKMSLITASFLVLLSRLLSSFQ
nr:integumentary mucin C.1-like [Pseudochaenichthys georgianus]